MCLAITSLFITSEMWQNVISKWLLSTYSVAGKWRYCPSKLRGHGWTNGWYFWKFVDIVNCQKIEKLIYVSLVYFVEIRAKLACIRQLTKVANSHILCSIQTHRHLLKVSHLIPENTLIGQNEQVPGVLAGSQNNPKCSGENCWIFLSFWWKMLKSQLYFHTI